MIDWNGKLEAVHQRTGKITKVELDQGEAQPDMDGDYIIINSLDCGVGYGPQVFRPDGEAWVDDGEDWSAWTIRNIVGEI